jgi:hypothetical protein
VRTIVPDRFSLDVWVRKTLEEFKRKSHEAMTSVEGAEEQNSDGSDLLSFSFLWGAMMTVILAFFLMSCIQQFAQFYQTMKNNIESDRLRSLLPASMRTSPIRQGTTAEILFVQRHSPNPVVINRGSAEVNQIPQAARSFANKIKSQGMPKYDIIHLSTAYPADYSS